MTFNKDQCRVLHLGWKNQTYKYKMSNDWQGFIIVELGPEGYSQPQVERESKVSHFYKKNKIQS